MKYFTKLLLAVVSFSVVSIAVANEIEEFQEIGATGSIIVETTPKATRGIDWNFELTNHDDKNEQIHILLKNGDQQILPALAQHEFETTQGYYPLEKGKTVRVAGLDLTKPIELVVLTSSDIWNMEQEGPFAKGKDSVLKNAKNEGRSRKGTVGEDKTIFMVFEKGTLKPVAKGLFKRSTDSGLPLDRNIEK